METKEKILNIGILVYLWLISLFMLVGNNEIPFWRPFYFASETFIFFPLLYVLILLVKHTITMMIIIVITLFKLYLLLFQIGIITFDPQEYLSQNPRYLWSIIGVLIIFLSLSVVLILNKKRYE